MTARHLAAWRMTTTILVTLATCVVVAHLADDDPCAGHRTPDGITADHMADDPCNEMPGVA